MRTSQVVFADDVAQPPGILGKYEADQSAFGMLRLPNVVMEAWVGGADPISSFVQEVVDHESTDLTCSHQKLETLRPRRLFSTGNLEAASTTMVSLTDHSDSDRSDRSPSDESSTQPSGVDEYDLLRYAIASQEAYKFGARPLILVSTVEPSSTFFSLTQTAHGSAIGPRAILLTTGSRATRAGFGSAWSISIGYLSSRNKSKRILPAPSSIERTHLGIGGQVASRRSRRGGLETQRQRQRQRRRLYHLETRVWTDPLPAARGCRAWIQAQLLFSHVLGSLHGARRHAHGESE